MAQASASQIVKEMGTPFPRLPMLAIAVGLVSHAFSLSSLFPYVGYMVQYLGVTDDKDEVGYYAGYLSSAFMVGRFASSYFWGRFADTYGRLPVLYIGLNSIVVMSLSFGLSTNFWWALASRFLLGAINGLVAISKCLISEICGKEHEVVGMGFVAGCWSFGLVIGPGLGGLLAEPAKHYPSVFSESGFFGRYPYLLPNIVGAGIAFSALPLVYFFLRETSELTNGIGDKRAGFKPLPTKDASGVETLDAGMEEGQSLEMTPLTQQNSLDNSGNDNDDEGGSNREGNRDGVVRIGDGTEAAAVVIGETGSRRRGRGDSSGDSARSEDDPTKDDNQVFDSGRLGGKGGQRCTQRNYHNVSGGHNASDGSNRDGNRSGVEAHLGIKETGDQNSTSGDADAGLESRGGADHGMKTATTMATATAASREIIVSIPLLQERRVRAILFVYGIYSFAFIGFGEVYPLWALSTVASGGLDWTTKEIGLVLALSGVGMVAYQLLVYPCLSKRMGMTRSQRLASLLSIPIFLCFPFLSGMHNSGMPLVVCSVLFNFLANTMSSAILVNIGVATNNAVDPSRRATLNGLSMTVGSLAKAVGPAFLSAIFAWSIDGEWRPFPFDYHLVFYVLALSMAAVGWSSWNVMTDDPPPPTEPKVSASGGGVAAHDSAEGPFR